MASPAQVRANRENAQRSTGPRTEAGKQATKFNALKHGLAAESLVICGEDPAELDALRAQLRADYSPAGETEAMLVEEIAQCWWRLQRTRSVEARAIDLLPDRPYDLGPLIRYMTQAERGWHRAITQLRTVQNDRRKRETSDPVPSPDPQPIEEEKVMAVGSVPQSDPEPAASTLAPSGISSHPRNTEIRGSKEFADRFRHAMLQELEMDIQNAEAELRREGK
jgi:hypothetical protein